MEILKCEICWSVESKDTFIVCLECGQNICESCSVLNLDLCQDCHIKIVESF